MTTPPNLLNQDGCASIATAVMMSHHGFRRDLARFARALERVADGDTSRVQALQEEWKIFHMTLHGHHHSEDSAVFPSLAEKHASVRATIERLSADHRKIDPLLERADQAFAKLAKADEAAQVIAELRALLDPHLTLEEAELIPHLRDAKEFPPPPDDEAVAMYAQGFAWAMQGIAPEVVERVQAMLPQILLTRLPAARAAFEERCVRVWGSAAAGASRTPVPDGAS